MTPLQFCYWLQGYFELNPAAEPLTAAQVELIKQHLALAFKKETDALESVLTRLGGGLKPHAPNMPNITTGPLTATC